MDAAPWPVGDKVRILVVGDGSDPAAWERIRELAHMLATSSFPVLDFDAPAAPLGGPSPWLQPPFPVRQPEAGSDGPRQSGIEAIDLLVIDPALEIEAADLEELRRVAGTDPMIAGVVPRFEQGSLCPLPGRRLGSAVERAATRALLRRRLPPVTYAVLPDSRCLYVKGSVLARFGSEPVDKGAVWEGYALSLNRLGFRVAIANHAFAGVPDGSTAQGAPPRLGRLEQVYPGTRHAVSAFLSSAARHAERLLAAPLRDHRTGKLAIAFDLAHLGTRHSGSSDLAFALVGRAGTGWQDCALHVIASAPVFDFHFGRSEFPLVRADPGDDRSFAAIIRIGQPFSWKDLDRVVGRAPALIVFLLDTIGLDCCRTAPDGLDAIWRFTLAEADGLVFNSRFTEQQFERRFPIRPDLPRRVSLHSLDVEDYRDGSGEPGETSDAILVVGNRLDHKFVGETANDLARAGLERPILALGLDHGGVAGVEALPSGNLSRDKVASLFRRAGAVVYPTVYEGFGLPVLLALAHRKPVFVRHLPPFVEIAAGVPEAANIHFYDDEAALIDLLRADPGWIEDRRPGMARNWEACAGDLRCVLDEALERVSFERVLRRVEYVRGQMAWARRRAFEPSPRLEPIEAGDGEDIDRLAGFAGRTAHGLVHRMSRVRAVRRALSFAAAALFARREP